MDNGLALVAPGCVLVHADSGVPLLFGQEAMAFNGDTVILAPGMIYDFYWDWVYRAPKRDNPPKPYSLTQLENDNG